VRHFYRPFLNSRIEDAQDEKNEKVAGSMSWEAWFTLGITGLGIAALIREVLAPDLIFLGLLALLLAARVLTPEEALVGFANPGVVSIGALFVVAGALQHTGALEFVATRIFGQIKSARRSLVRMMIPVAGASAFLNSTPIVAMFIPVVVGWTRRHGVSPSRFLIPLSFATILGGTCTLIGTSTNLVGNSLMIASGMPGLSFFELSAVGLPCALVGLTYITFIGWHLLPDRKGLIEQIEDDRREYLVELEVTPECPLVGRRVEQAGLRHLPGLFLISIERKEEMVAPVGPQERIQVGDRMVFTGVVSTIVDLQKIRGLIPAGEHRDGREHFLERANLSESVISEDSPLIGSTIRAANFRTRYGAAVVAVHRGGQRISGKIGDIILHAGDTLLLEAPAEFARAYRNSADFYLVSEVHDSAPPRYDKAVPALLVLIVLVVTVTAGILPMMTAALLAAFTVVMLGCLSIGETRGVVDMSVLLLIAAAFGIGKAMDKTGAAEVLASILVEVGAGLGPLGVLAAVYLATSIFSEVISNAAAVVLVFPIACEAARQFGVDARPFAIAVTVAASSSFASPLGYHTNLMVYGAGGYRFLDFIKIGLPLKVILFVVSMVCIPYAWPF